MGNVKDLMSPGKRFKATGARSFEKQLKGATVRGALSNLRDNTEAITKVIGDYQKVIKTRGGLSRLQKKGAFQKISKMDPNLLKCDRKDIKKILEHLGRKKPIKKIAPQFDPMSDDRKIRNIAIGRASRRRVDEELAKRNNLINQPIAPPSPPQAPNPFKLQF